MKRVLFIALSLMLLTSQVFGADISDWIKGDGTDAVEGADNISDLDTITTNYLQDPLDRLLTEYIHGCTLTYATAATVTIGVGEVTCWNAAKTIKRMRRNTSTVTITLPAADASGDSLDTGNAAVSTWYYVYAVAGDSPADTFTGICSASASAPTGYTYYRKIGAFYNNASDNIDSNSVTSYDNGKVVQVLNYQTGAVATGTTSITFDDSIPQNDEGDQYMSLTITPTSATNKLKIDVVTFAATSDAGGGYIATALFQDTTASALACSASYPFGDNVSAICSFTHYMTSGTASATTFKVRVGASSGTVTFNGVSGGRIFGGVLASSITITEIQS